MYIYIIYAYMCRVFFLRRARMQNARALRKFGRLVNYDSKFTTPMEFTMFILVIIICVAD